MGDNFEQAGKKILEFAHAGQGCPILDEVRQLNYTDITKAFVVAQVLENYRMQNKSEPQLPLVTFTWDKNNSKDFASVEVQLLDPSRDVLPTNIFHYSNAVLGTEQTDCVDLKPKK